MKLFRAVGQNFEAIGFSAPSQPNQICTFNGRNLFYIFAVAGMFIPLMGFLLFNATTAYEYSISFYLSIVMITMTTYCAVLIYKIGSIFELIGKYKKFTENRKRWIDYVFSHVNKIEIRFSHKFHSFQHRNKT